MQDKPVALVTGANKGIGPKYLTDERKLDVVTAGDDLEEQPQPRRHFYPSSYQMNESNAENKICDR